MLETDGIFFIVLRTFDTSVSPRLEARRTPRSSCGAEMHLLSMVSIFFDYFPDGSFQLTFRESISVMDRIS